MAGVTVPERCGRHCFECGHLQLSADYDAAAGLHRMTAECSAEGDGCVFEQDEQRDWLTPDECADDVRIPHSWTETAVRQGEIPSYRYGRYPRVKKADWEAYKASHKFKPKQKD